eukprot:2232249-Pleurochrysis_carterae.AAC.1
MSISAAQRSARGRAREAPHRPSSLVSAYACGAAMAASFPLPLPVPVLRRPGASQPHSCAPLDHTESAHSSHVADSLAATAGQCPSSSSSDENEHLGHRNEIAAFGVPRRQERVVDKERVVDMKAILLTVLFTVLLTVLLDCAEAIRSPLLLCAVARRRVAAAEEAAVARRQQRKAASEAALRGRRASLASAMAHAPSTSADCGGGLPVPSKKGSGQARVHFACGTSVNFCAACRGRTSRRRREVVD